MSIAVTASCYTSIVNRRIGFGVLTLGLTCAAFVVAGASQSAPQQSSGSAKSLAHLLEEHYRQPHTLQAVFLERFSEGEKQSRVESGTVYFRRPGQMRWEYDSPEKKLFLVDGKTTWFYVPYDHTVTKAPVKESSDWRTPFSLLTRKADLSHLCAKIELIDQKGIPSGHAVLRCLPKEAKSVSDGSDYTEVLTGVGQQFRRARANRDSAARRHRAGISLRKVADGYSPVGRPVPFSSPRRSCHCGWNSHDGHAPIDFPAAFVAQPLLAVPFSQLKLRGAGEQHSNCPGHRGSPTENSQEWLSHRTR